MEGVFEEFPDTAMHGGEPREEEEAQGEGRDGETKRK